MFSAPQIINNRSENFIFFNYCLNLAELYLYKNDFYLLTVALIILSIFIFLFSTRSHNSSLVALNFHRV